MKTLKQTCLLVLLCGFTAISGQAQANQQQTYWIHEDVVKPSKVAEYEDICRSLIAALKEHRIPGENWIASSTADNRYLYIGPIDNMASLERARFVGLAEKMGQEAMRDLFTRMDACYDTEHDYILHLDEELTYMPEGITQIPENMNFRMYHYLHLSPANGAVVREKMKAVKALFMEKGSEVSYRIYRSGFGTRGEFYLVAVAARDAEQYAVRDKANDQLLGEAGAKAFGELFGNLLKYEVIAGQMRPEFYYRSEN